MDSKMGIGEEHDKNLEKKRLLLLLPEEEEGRWLKKGKHCGELEEEVDDDMKKVAEIVLVLAALGKMRGGDVPSLAEIEMMEDARSKLVDLSQHFPPKDVFPTHAFPSLIHDLGLQHKSGFHPPNLSIAQKLNSTKQKMEDSEKYAPRSAKCTSQTEQSNISSSAQSHPGGQPASSLGPLSAGNSTPLPYQLPTSEIRASVSGGLPSSDHGKHASALALPRAERPYFTLNGKTIEISYTSKVQADSSGDDINSSVMGGTPDLSKMASEATISKTLITQTTSMNAMGLQQHFQQGLRHAQSQSPINSHNEIGKIVQKLLKPKLSECPIWTPPSRDYMNKALPCQYCKIIINEVNNVLVCDACEKGYHLNCLQLHKQESIPRAEWQCGKCFSLSNGKPLPPKYGRVMRNSTLLKVSSHEAAAQLSKDKNVQNIVAMNNLERMVTNGNSGTQSAPTSALVNSTHIAPTAQMGDVGIMQGNETTSSKGGHVKEHPCRYHANDLIGIPGTPVSTSNHMAIHGEKVGVKSMQMNGSCSSIGKTVKEQSSGPGADNLAMTLGSVSGTPDNCKVERLVEEKTDPDCTLQHSAISDTVCKTFNDSQYFGHREDSDHTELTNIFKIPSEQCLQTNDKVVELDKSCGDFLEHKLCNPAKEDNIKVSVNPNEATQTCVGHKEHGGSLSDSLHDLNWTGDILQVVDEKTYYQSCLVHGVLYKVQDHVLFHSNNNILTPFKLQGMWEDNKTRSKWVVASRCYFPADLPEAVGRPCSPETNEVYESNHDTTLSAGLIKGPCEVLPPRTFIEETERRAQLGMGRSDSLHPLFICKWFYDERKGLFRIVTN